MLHFGPNLARGPEYDTCAVVLLGIYCMIINSLEKIILDERYKQLNSQTSPFVKFQVPCFDPSMLRK